jgi:hypothetical protein
LVPNTGWLRLQLLAFAIVLSLVAFGSWWEGSELRRAAWFFLGGGCAVAMAAPAVFSDVQLRRGSEDRVRSSFLTLDRGHLTDEQWVSRDMRRQRRIALLALPMAAIFIAAGVWTLLSA